MSSASGYDTEMSGSESDIEMQSALPSLTNKKKKMPKSPTDELLKSQEPKKMTTKDMIKEALTEQKSRKGISLHAIRKFIVEKHAVNAERITMLIKKSLKSGIEEGSIVQTKGIGASGSFKLAPKKKSEATEKPKKKPQPKKPSDKIAKAKNTKKDVEKKENPDKKVTKKKVESQTSKMPTIDKPVKKDKQEKKQMQGKEKKDKAKMAKTPAKKRADMMKRKSIGSIIKPPKMKPKART